MYSESLGTLVIISYLYLKIGNETNGSSVQFSIINVHFVVILYTYIGTDYGRLMNLFFHQNPKLLGLGRQIGQINFGAFGVFSAKLSAPSLVQWVPCPCFPLFNQYFNKKLSLYIHIPNIYLGLGFEFGPQRNLGLSLHVSVVSAQNQGIIATARLYKEHKVCM